MTIPVERTQAVIYTGEFLCMLIDPKRTPRVPRAVREYAMRCLRHYPDTFHMRLTANKAPDIWGLPDGK